MRRLSPLLSTDFYKIVHHLAYKPGLESLTSYWTPRMTRFDSINKVVMFGLQAFIKEGLIERFNKDFFERPLDEVVAEYKRVITHTLSADYADTEHIEELHKLGYLPIEISAVSEGTRVPIKVPMIRITNTDKRFGWLVNYLETYISCNIWQPMTSASIAYRFKEIVSEYYEKTGCTRDVKTACGDFSMRGMPSEDSACSSSAGHLLSFTGTATIPAINWLEQFYNANIEEEVVGTGTPSMEHSVMCTYGREELDAYRHLITEAFPKGPLSIVSDTYDYWGIFENVLPALKNEIMTRDGKIIIRGDSGDPVDIICGKQVKEYNDLTKFLRDANIDWYYDTNSVAKLNDKYYKAVDRNDTDMEYLNPVLASRRFADDLVWVECEAPLDVKGTIELLWDIFGGTVNKKGYKVLDPHVAAIYGDGITLERCKNICERLEKKGFATENITFGIGSFTYCYVTRDSLGFALKATNSVINGIETLIYKDPKTDKDNFKKSQRGECIVYRGKDGEITYEDGLNAKTYADRKEQVGDLLEPVFRDGKLLKEFTLEAVRKTLEYSK